MGAPVMKNIAACAVMLFLGLATNFLGLATHARAAELVEKQWSALFPDHTAIPEKFGAPIRERFSASDTMRPPGVQMPVFAPGRKVIPSLAEPKE
jgi:hypothetical protein